MRFFTDRFIPLNLFISILFLLCSQPSQAESDHIREIQKAIAATRFDYVVMVNYRPVVSTGTDVLNSLYQKQNYSLFWSNGEGFTAKAGRLLTALKNSVHHGLNPREYFVAEISAQSQIKTAEAVAKTDVLLTAGAIRYALDLTIGHPALLVADPINFAEISDLDLNPSTLLEQIRTTESVEELFNKLAPSHDHYLKLKQELAKLLELSTPTDSQKQVIDSLRVNMARWRWLPHNLGDRYVLVNITNARLHAYNNNKVELNFPVIVGKNENQTPVTSGFIRHVEIFPSWNIPTNIAKTEQLKKLQTNPRHLVEKKVRLFSSWDADAKEIDSTTVNWKAITPERMTMFRLRQDPGPHNSLGKIKFIFPNPWSIYLHDTPGHMLFNETNRGLSHGCIRVHDPVGLAQFILNKQDKYSSAAAIKSLIDVAKQHDLEVKRPVAIHICYQTIFIDAPGKLRFIQDVYGQDKKILAALNRK